MIFVTVGTHEQPFNRLIEYIDYLAEKQLIKEEFFIQIGYSTYQPKFCKWKKMLPYSEMIEKVKEASIVVTHGGPSSFIMPLQYGKIPIVFPRRSEYGEHVNNHQVEFANAVEKRQNNIIVAEDKEHLYFAICEYNNMIRKMKTTLMSNNDYFCAEFEKMVQELMLN